MHKQPKSSAQEEYLRLLQYALTIPLLYLLLVTGHWGYTVMFIVGLLGIALINGKLRQSVANVSAGRISKAARLFAEIPGYAFHLPMAVLMFFILNLHVVTGVAVLIIMVIGFFLEDWVGRQKPQMASR